MNVPTWAFNSSGETTAHGLVFLISWPVQDRATRGRRHRAWGRSLPRPLRLVEVGRRGLVEQAALSPLTELSRRFAPACPQTRGAFNHEACTYDTQHDLILQARFLDEGLGYANPARIANLHEPSLHDVPTLCQACLQYKYRYALIQHNPTPVAASPRRELRTGGAADRLLR